MARFSIGCFLLLASFLRSHADEAAPVELTTAAAVRALGESEHEIAHPVRLRGVVLLEPTRGRNSFVLGDQSAAAYIESDPRLSAGLERGDLIEVQGRTSRRGFAPFVVASLVTKQGTAPIPPPPRVTFDQLATGRCDAQWVEVAGIVRRSGYGAKSSVEGLVDLATGGGRLTVRFREVRLASLPVDAEITVAGIAFYQFSRSGQMIHPFLVVPEGAPAVITTPPPATIPLRKMDRIMTFSSDGSYGHRIRVRGVVTHHQPGDALWIAEDGRGIRALWTGPGSFAPGEAVEVAGFPVQGNYSPEMEDVVVQRLAVGLAPPPVALKNSSAALDHDAGLVRVNARLIEVMRVPRGLRLDLRDEEGDFSARLRTDGIARPETEWQPGAQVQVCGICSVAKVPPGSSPGTVEPREFELILRSPADLLVIEPPPWWNAERRARLLAATTAALGLVVGFVFWVARRRLRQSAEARRQSEAEFAAILAERSRIAREIHDTLAQGLGAISMQLELVKDQLPAGSEAAVHIANASGLTRQSLREARDSIWNMRSQALEDHDLPGALAGVLDQLTDIDGLKATFQVTGDRYRLPPVAENNLLRIGQEAVTNAVKHASARHIEVTLGFSAREVILRVKDDGGGFDPGKRTTDNTHFGLVGLRERARAIGASLRIESSPGHGTEVILELPTTPPPPKH